MAKKASGDDADPKAQRDVRRARERLHAARERYSDAEARGERRMAKARNRADAWLAEADEWLQRRATTLAKIEAQRRDLDPDGALPLATDTSSTDE